MGEFKSFNIAAAVANSARAGVNSTGAGSSDVVSKTIEAKKQEVMRLVAQNGENIAGW